MADGWTRWLNLEQSGRKFHRRISQLSNIVCCVMHSASVRQSVKILPSHAARPAITALVQWNYSCFGFYSKRGNFYVIYYVCVVKTGILWDIVCNVEIGWVNFMKNIWNVLSDFVSYIRILCTCDSHKYYSKKLGLLCYHVSYM